MSDSFQAHDCISSSVIRGQELLHLQLILMWQSKLYIISKQASSFFVMLFTVGMFAYADSSTVRSRRFYHNNDAMKQNLHRNLRK